MPQIEKPFAAADLAELDLFKDDTMDTLEWLAGLFEVRAFADGEEVVKSGDPARDFVVILSGELHFQREGDPYGGVYIGKAGEATGVLPFSRMTVHRGRGWAVGKTRVLSMTAAHLPEMIRRAPCLTQKLVYKMIDRSRDATQRDERANKMLALGKLSAGLAHELNNPASAVVRSSTRLREALVEARKHMIAMRSGSQPIPQQAQDMMHALGELVTESARFPRELDALERADLEGDLADWLEARGLNGAAASALVDCGIRVDRIEPLANLIGCEALDHGLRLLAADHEILSLSREIEEASRRIADLVQSVKTYSYMDRSPVTQVDIEQGIDITLRMFQHQLRLGFQVKKLYAGNLPRVNANGSELNQVWTNLIDNAIDAMSASEVKVLEIRTCIEPGYVLVEISDSGAGIPPEVQSRIFDAFFTTKEVGKGTGLGLDIVHRIVREHKGSIHMTSVPGRTTFQVRLPQ